MSEDYGAEWRVMDFLSTKAILQEQILNTL